MSNNEQLRQLLADCSASTKVTSKVLFPDRFTRPFSSIHDLIFKVLDDPKIRRVVIAASRGIGKTSIASFAYPAKRILFDQSKFIMMVGAASDMAIRQTENLKQELRDNSLINQIFGPVKRKTSVDWAKEQWITDNGTMVLPRGAGQKVRGLLHRGRRPDLIIVDDLEDDKMVDSDDYRKDIREWLYGSLFPCVDRGSDNWKIVYIDTVKHEDAAIMHLLNDPDWFHIRLPLCDENYKSNWPEFTTDDEVQSLIESYRRRGMLDHFAREYMAQAVAKENAAFKSEMFRYYDEGEIQNDAEVESVVIIDPAKTRKKTSDKTAIVGIGINARQNKIYVRDIINERLHPEEMFDQSFAMCKSLNARTLGIEVTSLHEFATYPLRNEILRRGLPVELVEINSTEDKRDRVSALIPFYRQGLIYHNRQTCGPLETQLLSFPRSQYWDVMDCLANIVPMLDSGERFFSCAEDDGEVEREFDRLRDEDADLEALADWRIA